MQPIGMMVGCRTGKCSTGGMQDCREAGQVGIGLEGCRIGGAQDRSDAGQEGCCSGGMKERSEAWTRKDAGQVTRRCRMSEESRKVGMQEMRNAGKEGF